MAAGLRRQPGAPPHPGGLSGKGGKALIPALGAVSLAELRPGHLQAFYTEALERGRADKTGGLSPRTVAQLHRILSKALSDAVKGELVARNVAEAVSPPRPRRLEMRSLSQDEVVRFLEAAGIPSIIPSFTPPCLPGCAARNSWGLGGGMWT